MGEVIQFVSKSERERLRLIREARALYESVFPSADPAGPQRDETSTAPSAGGSNPRRSDGGHA